MFLPGWVSGSQVKKTDDCPTQLKHDTVIFVSRQSPEFLCLRIIEVIWQILHEAHRYSETAQLPFRQHAPEGSLYFFLVLGGIVPVDGALESFPEENLRFPSQELLSARIIGDPV